MGIIIDVRDSSMGIENSRIKLLKESVDKELYQISDSLNRLSNYWKDEKSETKIRELKELLDGAKRVNIEAEQATEEYLRTISQILKSY